MYSGTAFVVVVVCVFLNIWVCKLSGYGFTGRKREESRQLDCLWCRVSVLCLARDSHSRSRGSLRSERERFVRTDPISDTRRLVSRVTCVSCDSLSVKLDQRETHT